MPKVNVTTNGNTSRPCFVEKNGIRTPAVAVHYREQEVYVHYVGTDKRMDEWVDEKLVTEEASPAVASSATRGQKRKRQSTANANGARPRVDTENRSSDMSLGNGQSVDAPPLTEEELDLREHNKITATRNFDKVNFGQWQIKTWYFSPYPLSESEVEEIAAASATNKLSSSRAHNVNRASLRSHGRTSDLLAGGLGRETASGQKAILWVCDRCFKYMREGHALELHSKSCHIKHPPGRKVYQRGAHIIWEVDGATEKLFCQNLSLFGKLFIDIKTLFFDTENFLFYLLTDADSQRDHVLGFFSKEKFSFDDYNLACIVTFPPYQRKRYGMLMIEFSYELSRRAGKLGTPERPLSDLGLRGYLTYWIAALVRFFRRVLSINPIEVVNTLQHEESVDPDLIRFIDADGEASRSRRKKSRGWNGDMEVTLHGQDPVAATSGAEDALYRNMRFTRTSANADGSVTTHVFAKCTLLDIANATSMRMDDIAFTLNECGLLQRRKTLGGEDAEHVVVISREMIEAIATERNVKKMCMEVQHVLL